MADKLTWEELADIYDSEHNGRKARTLPMGSIFEWAERQPHRFRVDDDGYLYRREENTGQTKGQP